MRIVPFERAMIPGFLELANREGWIVAPWEFGYLLTVFPEGCRCALDEEGTPTGFVTAARHSASGWIGNLIVAPSARGKGIGQALFLAARTALQEAGAATIWLTASTQGRPLYERHGFVPMDGVYRWLGESPEPPRKEPAVPGAALAPESVLLDEAGWGDRRSSLIACTLTNGTLLERPGGFLVAQRHGDRVQLGPFAAANAAMAEELLCAAQGRGKTRGSFFLDAPAGNTGACELYERQRFRRSGRTELMYAGKRPDYRPELIYGLATMGSCG